MRSKNRITHNPPPPIAEKPHPRESTKDRPIQAAQLDLTQPTELIIGETSAKKPIRVTRGETSAPKLAYTHRRKDKCKKPSIRKGENNAVQKPPTSTVEKSHARHEGQAHPICSIQPTDPRSSSLNQSSSPNQASQNPLTPTAEKQMQNPDRNNTKAPPMQTQRNDRPQPTNPHTPIAEKTNAKSRQEQYQSTSYANAAE